MADDQTTVTPPLTNTTEARTTDGTLKDQGTTTLTDTSTTTDKTVDKPVEGTTLLTEADDKTEKIEDKKPAEGAPEKYEAFKAPEGYEFDEKGQAEATTLFKELGLNQAQAQKLMDVYAQKSIEAQKDATESAATAYAEMRKSWQDEVRADPEIGKILPAVKATIGRALDSLGDKALTDNFKAAMDLTGSGDHPAFVKTFYKLAQAVVEGSHVAGAGPSPLGQTSNGTAKRPTAAQAMYPNLPSSNS